MRHAVLVVVACSLLAAPSPGQDYRYFPDGVPPKDYGGIMIIRRCGQTTFSLGGVLLPRHVKVATATPEGPVVTRFVLPSKFSGAPDVPFPPAPASLAPAYSSPAFLHVEIPDENGVLYVEGNMVRSYGMARQLQSPDLPVGATYPLKMRGVFKAGNNLLVQDKQVLLRPGESTVVKFDGTGAHVIPLP